MSKNIVDKIKNTVAELGLDLTGKVVLTEAATGAYVVTPIIAACAGAKVYAYTKTTKYGSVKEVSEQTYALANQLGVADSIAIITELNPEMIGQADILTNSGHLRPISIDVLKSAKQGAVIPYMYEKWEFREVDIDLNYCNLKKIKVVATNERHPKIDVFNYLGELLIKQIHDAGKCIYNNKFIVISNNDFGPYLANTLSKLAYKVGVYDELIRKNSYTNQVEWLGEFSDIVFDQEYKDAEAVIFTAYPFVDKWFSEAKKLTIDFLLQLNNPFLIRYAGDIDTKLFDQNNINYYPDTVKPGHMGILLSDIGFDPIIRLQAGGLKVADLACKDEYLFENEIIGMLL